MTSAEFGWSTFTITGFEPSDTSATFPLEPSWMTLIDLTFLSGLSTDSRRIVRRAPPAPCNVWVNSWAIKPIPAGDDDSGAPRPRCTSCPRVNA